MTPEYAPERGLIRLPRRLLEAIVGGDRAVLDPSTDLGGLAHHLGVVRLGRVDAGLGPLLEPLRRPTARFGLRVERADGVTRHRGWVAAGGVVTVSGGVEPDDVQDLRAAPRPTAVARVLGQLLGLGPARPVTDLPDGPLHWDEVVAAVRGEAVWAKEALGPGADVALHHLRWSPDGTSPATTVMVLLSAGRDGLVEARPGDDGHRLLPRHPVEVWTGLCALARSV